MAPRPSPSMVKPTIAGTARWSSKAIPRPAAPSPAPRVTNLPAPNSSVIRSPTSLETAMATEKAPSVRAACCSVERIEVRM